MERAKYPKMYSDLHSYTCGSTYIHKIKFKKCKKENLLKKPKRQSGQHLRPTLETDLCPFPYTHGCTGTQPHTCTYKHRTPTPSSVNSPSSHLTLRAGTIPGLIFAAHDFPLFSDHFSSSRGGEGGECLGLVPVDYGNTLPKARMLKKRSGLCCLNLP